MNKKIALSLISALLLSTAAYADGEAAAAAEAAMTTTDVEAEYTANASVEASDELKQNINFGFANTTGNTDTLNINGKYIMSFTTVGYEEQPLKVGFDASFFLTENDDVKDNEEYTANLGLEQNVYEGWLGYAGINWLRNEFRNFDNKFAIGAGVGRELYNDGQHTLTGKFGLAYNIEQYSNGQEDDKFGSLNQYLEYHNTLNETSALYVKLGALEKLDDFADYQVLAVAGLNFTVADNVNVSIEEEIRYDKEPPVGFKSTDTKTIIRAGYSF